MGILCGEKVHIAMNTTTSVISLKKKKNKQKVARIRYRMQKSRKSFQTIPVKNKDNGAHSILVPDLYDISLGPVI